MKRFTYEGGRQIYFDGEPFMYIQREGKAVPTDVDEAAKLIASLLNRAKYVPHYTSRKNASRDRSYPRYRRRA